MMVVMHHMLPSFLSVDWEVSVSVDVSSDAMGHILVDVSSDVRHPIIIGSCAIESHCTVMMMVVIVRV